MKQIYTIGLIILSLTIFQQAFPQEENTKSPLTGVLQIELSEGYNFISSRIIAENPDMQDILQNNLDNLEFVRNSAGLMLRKIGPNWVNSIGNWVNTEGYLFKMNSTDELTIIGNVIDPQTPIILSTGYQIIGYLPNQPLNTEDIFQDILENLEFVRNSTGLMLRKIGTVWVNSIGDMQPGEGYLVKMLTDDILIYPSPSFTCGDPFTDPRNGQTYNTVQIGGQCWMAENLNIGTRIDGTEEMTNNSVIEKYCHTNNIANCDEFGGLYQWNEMMEYSTTPGVQGVCPAGWHIPTDYEWKILEGTVDSQYPVGDPIWNNIDWRGYDAGFNLKSTSGWHESSNGSGLYSFNALPGGYRFTDGCFPGLTRSTTFWSSSEYYTNSAWHRHLNFDYDNVYRSSNEEGYGFSVRCLNDDNISTNYPPESPSFPNPENGAENQSIEIDLSWTCTDPEGDPLTYDIYFGLNATPPLVSQNQIETTYDPGTLENNGEYFWKIVAYDIHNPNGTEGPVWSFITEEEGGGQYQCGDPFTDPRNGQTYNTVQIGDQCWMAENLNIGIRIDGTEEMTNNSVIEKYCYNNSNTNCNEYGGLYQWNEMMEYSTTPGVQGICPAGWHIPTDYEWKILEGTVDSQYPVGDPIWNNIDWRGYDVGINLKSTSGWHESGNGSGLYCFDALPGGYRFMDGSFPGLTRSATFWSSSEYTTNSGWHRHLNFDYDNVYRGSNIMSYGFSVRCVHD